MGAALPQDAVRQLLINAAIVGSRIYPQVAVKNPTMPYIVYHWMPALHHHHMGGSSGLVEGRIQLDVCSDNYTTVRGKAELVRLALDGYNGTVAVGANTLAVILSLENDIDDFEGPLGAGETFYHRVILDYIVYYNETIPTFS